MTELVRFAEDLLRDAAFERQGHQMGDLPFSVILVDFPESGMGPKLHGTHILSSSSPWKVKPYLPSAMMKLPSAPEMVIAPANTPHKFSSAGNDRLRQVDIHASGRFDTEWLEE